MTSWATNRCRHRRRFMYSVLIYLSRYFDQETAKGPFRSFDQAATCYYTSKGRGSPVMCLAQGHNNRTGLSLH